MNKIEKNEIIEHLIRTADKVAIREKKYLVAKNNLEVLKAKYILENDWEGILGKPKPTQKEKDAYVTVQLEEKVNELNDLKLQAEYCRRIFEIHFMAQKYIKED